MKLTESVPPTQHDNLKRQDVETLVDQFPGQSIDFFGALRARIYDDAVRGFVKDLVRPRFPPFRGCSAPICLSVFRLTMAALQNLMLGLFLGPDPIQVGARCGRCLRTAKRSWSFCMFSVVFPPQIQGA